MLLDFEAVAKRSEWWSASGRDTEADRKEADRHRHKEREGGGEGEEWKHQRHKEIKLGVQQINSQR